MITLDDVIDMPDHLLPNVRDEDDVITEVMVRQRELPVWRNDASELFVEWDVTRRGHLTLEPLSQPPGSGRRLMIGPFVRSVRGYEQIGTAEPDVLRGLRDGWVRLTNGSLVRLDGGRPVEVSDGGRGLTLGTILTEVWRVWPKRVVCEDWDRAASGEFIGTLREVSK
jgi:hypothetical protein